MTTYKIVRSYANYIDSSQRYIKALMNQKVLRTLYATPGNLRSLKGSAYHSTHNRTTYVLYETLC